MDKPKDWLKICITNFCANVEASELKRHWENKIPLDIDGFETTETHTILENQSRLFKEEVFFFFLINKHP